MSDITLSGNLTREPELRYAGDVPVCEFSVAENRNVQSNGGEDRKVSFYDCSAWRGLGEHVAESLHKGDAVVIRGRMEQQRWVAEDGTPRSKHVINVFDVGPSLKWANAKVLKIARTDAPVTAGAPAAADAGTDVGVNSGDEPF